MTSTAKNAVPATTNPEWGFWGTLTDQGHTDEDVTAMWEHTAATLAEIHDAPIQSICDLLDTRAGRHLADEFGHTLQIPQWFGREVEFYRDHSRARGFGEDFTGKPHQPRRARR